MAKIILILIVIFSMTGCSSMTQQEWNQLMGTIESESNSFARSANGLANQNRNAANSISRCKPTMNGSASSWNNVGC